MSEELKVPRIARVVTSFVERHFFVAVALALALVGGLATGLPKIRADFSHRGFFYDDDPLLVAFDAFERRFGNDDAILVAVHSPSGVFDEDTATLLQEMTRKMWLVPEVIRVDSLANYNWVHADGDDLLVEPLIPDDLPLTAELLAERERVAMRHEVIPDYLVSRDGKTALVFGHIKPGIDRPPDAPTITAAVHAMNAELARTDHQFYVSGGPAVTTAFRDASVTDFSTLVPIVVLLTIFLIAVLLRSFLGVVLSLLVVVTSIVGSMGLAGLTGVEITNVTSVMPQILIAIGVADSVHVLVTFLRSMRRGADRKEAARYALLKNFLPTLITSITTAIGFFTFATADLKPVAGLGLLAGCGTLLAWVMTYLLLGSLLFRLPFRVKVAPERATERRRADAIAGFVRRYRAPILVGFGVVGVAALVASTRNTVNSDPFEYFAKGFPIRTANDFIEDQVGGVRGVELSIDTGREEGIKDPAFLAKVDAFQSWIDDNVRGVTRTISIVDVLEQTNRSLNADDQAFFRLPDTTEAVGQELFLYTMSLPQGMSLSDRVTVKNDALRLTVLWTISSSKDVVEAIEKIEREGERRGLVVSATGKNRLYQSMNGYVVRSFVVSVTAAVLLISLVLIVFFRSPGLGLLAMLPNAFPLLVGGGLLWVIDKPLDIGTVLVMSVCLGIAVDDTIHVLANFNRLLAEGKSRFDAVREIYANTGPALIVTTVILVSSFGTFMFATFTPNRYFGILCAWILSVALVTDLTFLPALLIGKRKAEADAEAARAEPVSVG